MTTVTGLTYIGGRYHGAHGNVLSRTGVDSAVHAARRVPARPRTRVTTKLDYSCSMCRKCTVSGGGIRGPWQVRWMAWPARRVSLARPTRQGVARTKLDSCSMCPQCAVSNCQIRRRPSRDRAIPPPMTILPCSYLSWRRPPSRLMEFGKVQTKRRALGACSHAAAWR